MREGGVEGVMPPWMDKGVRAGRMRAGSTVQLVFPFCVSPCPCYRYHHIHNMLCCCCLHTLVRAHTHVFMHAYTGKLTDTRQRFLGTRPPRLFAVSVRGERSLLALSSRPWLGYSDMGRWQFMPLSYEALDHAAVRLGCGACCRGEGAGARVGMG